MGSLARLLLLAGSLAVATGCGGEDRKEVAPRAARSPFAYDARAPLSVRERLVATRRDGIRVREISYSSRRERVTGFLVVPAKRGRYPAVIYLHGAGGSRFDFLGEAARMARRGAVALTLDSPHGASRAQPRRPALSGLRQFVEAEIQGVIDVRRAVDLLESRPEVDGGRLGLVGWSAGARAGAILAGVERRLRAFDLIAGGATPVGTYAAAAPRRLRGRVAALLARVDPLRYVRDAAPAALLFQAGRRDEVVPRRALLALVRAGSEPKRVLWYDGGHRPTAAALAAGRAWLAQQLAPRARGGAVHGRR